MKVALISNWDLQCGNAAYARDLQRELEKEFSVVGNPGNVQQIRRDLMTDPEVKVVIINWHPTRVTVTKEDIEWIQSAGAKVILIHQNYSGAGFPDMPANVTVGHEPISMYGTPCLPVTGNFQYIPHGIPEVPVSPVLAKQATIGTAGFPFPWKRFDVVAEAAKRFNMKCRMIAPKSDQLDTDQFVDGLVGHLNGLSELTRSWLPVEEVVRMLSECVVNIFWFQSYSPEDELGQSGSVRMGIAAKRPMIISAHRKLRTLWKYEDEFYICGREEDVYTALEEIRMAPHLAKRPNRILREQGWPVTGKMYRELVTEMAQ